MNEQLKKSLAVLGIALGKDDAKTLDTATVISHLELVKKSMAEALSECDERITKASEAGGSKEGIDLIAKSFGDVKATLDGKFSALGEVMQTIVLANAENDSVMKSMSSTVEAMADVVIGMKTIVEGMAEGDGRARSFTTQQFVEKSMGGGDGKDTKGIRSVSLANRQAVLGLFDELEGNLKKSSNEAGAQHIASMAAVYEASGVMEAEMYEAITSQLPVKLV